MSPQKHWCICTLDELAQQARRLLDSVILHSCLPDRWAGNQDKSRVPASDIRRSRETFSGRFRHNRRNCFRSELIGNKSPTHGPISIVPRGIFWKIPRGLICGRVYPVSLTVTFLCKIKKRLSHIRISFTELVTCGPSAGLAAGLHKFAGELIERGIRIV